MVRGSNRRKARTRPAVAIRLTAWVPGQLGYRDLVGTMVREVCLQVERDLGYDGLEWRVLSAFNEAFNNIVEHAYAAALGEVEVQMYVEDDRVVVRLVDQGEGFNYHLSGATDVPPDFDSMADGGMGLFIIRQVMSEVTYERGQNRNLLTMTKRLSECAPELGAQDGVAQC